MVFIGILINVFTIMEAEKHLPISYMFFHSSFLYWFIGPYVLLLFIKSIFQFTESFYLFLSFVFILITVFSHWGNLTHLGSTSNWGFYALPAYAVLAFQYVTIIILILKKLLQDNKLKRKLT